MSARGRVWIVVWLAALAAAGTVVGVTLATRSDVQRNASKPPPFASDPTARPEVAQPLYARFCDCLRGRGLRVGEGVFRASMQVRIVNEGPVTLLLDSRKGF